MAMLMRANETEFYERQINVDEIGLAGQKRLANSKVLVIGAGGLGCPALQYLVSAGVGQITIVDADCIDLNNLHRQPIYHIADVGQAKALVVADKLSKQNPYIQITPLIDAFSLYNAEELVTSHDVVLDCTDNFETNYLIHDSCQKLKTDCIMASIHNFEGIVHRYVFSQLNSPCLRCRAPEIPRAGCVGSCVQRGIISTLPGIFGCIQAQVLLHHILKIETLAHACSWIFDLRNMQSTQLAWSTNKSCSCVS
jgi:sulfur-carrier protein adenylyltransferase/sulfurtransferase